MDEDNEITFAIRPYESSEFEVKKENLGLKSFTTGLKLVGFFEAHLCVCIKQSDCVCVTQLYSSAQLQYGISH